MIVPLKIGHGLALEPVGLAKRPGKPVKRRPGKPQRRSHAIGKNGDRRGCVIGGLVCHDPGLPVFRARLRARCFHTSRFLMGFADYFKMRSSLAGSGPARDQGRLASVCGGMTPFRSMKHP